MSLQSQTARFNYGVLRCIVINNLKKKPLFLLKALEFSMHPNSLIY